jgi:hypothetical protein
MQRKSVKLSLIYVLSCYDLSRPFFFLNLPQQGQWVMHWSTSGDEPPKLGVYSITYW